MDCEEAEELIALWLDDKEFEQPSLRLHLATCGDCGELFADLILVQSLCQIVKAFWGVKTNLTGR